MYSFLVLSRAHHITICFAQFLIQTAIPISIAESAQLHMFNSLQQRVWFAVKIEQSDSNTSICASVCNVSGHADRN